MIIGLTGGSGTGKSTVVEFFIDKGYLLLDFDKISRDVCAPNTKCLKELTNHFGNDILNKDKTLNRKHLGNIVFKDKEKLKELNNITHKYILEEMLMFLSKNKDKNIIMDAPLLFEANIDKYCNKTIAILATKEARIERIMKRDGLTRRQSENRINSQPDDIFYINRANIVIANYSTIDVLYESLNKIFK